MAGNLALQGPELTVDAEDAVAEEFMEDVMVAGAFDVVGEVGEEEMLDVDGVSSADAMGEVEEGVDLDSGGWGLGEEFSDPVVEAAVVAEEAGEVSDDGVGFWRWVFGFRLRRRVRV